MGPKAASQAQRAQPFRRTESRKASRPLPDVISRMKMSHASTEVSSWRHRPSDASPSQARSVIVARGSNLPIEGLWLISLAAGQPCTQATAIVAIGAIG